MVSVSHKVFDENESGTHSINRIDALPTFITLPFHPMPIEICEKSVDIVGASGIPRPFTSVIPQ